MKRLIGILLLLGIAGAQAAAPEAVSVDKNGNALPLISGKTLNLRPDTKFNDQPLSSLFSAIRDGFASSSDVYIAARNDSLPGSGTLFDPYDGSTQTKFDAVMTALGNNSNIHIHLGPGTFQTNVKTRTWAVHSGWVIDGSGMYLTTLQMVGNIHLLNFELPVLTSSGSISNATVKNLTLDSNWSGLTGADSANGEYNHKTAGIDFTGSYNTIEQVRAINNYGSSANGQESFVINLSTGVLDGTDNTIRFCRAENMLGTYGSPFGMHGESATHWNSNGSVHDCVAVGNNTGLDSTIGFTSGSVNASNVKNCKVYNNLFVDCRGAYYQDTGNFDGIEVTGNSVIRGFQGVAFVTASPTTSKNLKITGNRFTIQNRTPGGDSYGIIVYGTSMPTSNVAISGNSVTLDRTGSGLNGFTFVNTHSMVSGKVSENTLFDSGGIGGNGWIGVNGLLNGTPDPAISVSNNVRADTNTTAPGMKTTTPTSAKDSSVTGSLRMAGTLSPAGFYGYGMAHDYVIQAGDVFQYEILCDENNPNFSPSVYLWSTTYIDAPLVDQNGLASAGDISAYAKGQWYYRSFLLTPFAGTTVHFVRVGQGEATSVGSFVTYHRNIKIVNSIGVPQAEYYTDNVHIPLIDSAFGSSNASSVVATPNFGGLVSSTPALLAISLDPFDGTANKFLNAAGHLVTTGVGTGDVVGPGSSTNDSVALMSGTTGKLIKNGGFNLKGGTVGQAWIKNSGTDYDAGWADLPGAGGGGTVTNFSAGDLSPLFTTSEATTTTTPALTFTKSNFAAHKFYGNNTGSTAAPDAQSINAADVGGLSASATTDTTVASNITSGTLLAARLPNPTASTLGGIQSYASVTHEWVKSISTAGVPTSSQPAVADLSDGSSLGRVPVVSTVTFSSTITPTLAASGATTIQDVNALTGNVVIAAPAASPAPVDGQCLKFRFLQDATGSRTVTWNAAYAFGTDITAALEPTTPSKGWWRAFEYDARNTRWVCSGTIRGL